MPKTNPITAVMIDQREPEHIRQLTFGDAAITVTLLDQGDIWVACADGTLLVCERKTTTDLLSSLADGRLLAQCASLRDVSPWGYLLITGLLYPQGDKIVTERGATGWSWGALQGALLSVQELGVNVLHVPGDEHLGRALTSLAGRPHDAVMRIVPQKAPRLLSDGETLLATLPGIGPERAADLLSYCESPAQALAFLTDMTGDNGHVAGIGPATKLKVRRMLGLPEWAELALISTEGKLLERGQHPDSKQQARYNQTTRS